MIALHRHHVASAAPGRDAKSIALALDDERGYLHCVELGQAALRRLAGALRWLERKSQAEDGDGARCVRGAASDASSSERPPTTSGKLASSPSRRRSRTATQAASN